MEAEYVILFVVAFAVMCIGLGYVNGAGRERASWVRRARTPKNPFGTAHYCDGEFYYVVRADVFLREYVRRRIVPPAGGSGTAPATNQESACGG